MILGFGFSVIAEQVIKGKSRFKADLELRTNGIRNKQWYLRANSSFMNEACEVFMIFSVLEVDRP